MTWTLKGRDHRLIDTIRSSVDVSPLVAHLMTNRGITAPSDAKEFLAPKLTPLPAQFDSAINRIADAVRRGETIMVHGDYDADGVTSTAILLGALRMLGAQAHHFIPDRYKHGYGFRADFGLKAAVDGKASVIITVDCGIKSFREVQAARQHGIDVVILDHHQIDGGLPDTPYIVSGQLLDEGSYHRHLCGAGLAFFYAMRLHGSLQRDPWDIIQRFADIAALGTVGDMVPLIGANRWIVREGIGYIRNAPSIGVDAIMREQKVDADRVTADNLSHYIVPTINASGRISVAETALQMLMADTPGHAAELAAQVTKLNEARQKMQRDLLAAVVPQAESRTTETIVLKGDFSYGLVGLLAGELVKRFGRPAVVFSDTGDNRLKGSARSVPGFDITECLRRATATISKSTSGGHSGAAGVSIPKRDFEKFASSFEEFFLYKLRAGIVPPEPITIVDDVLSIEDVGIDLVNDISVLEPFGQANPKPVFMIEDCNLENIRPMGEAQKGHFSALVAQGSSSIRGVAFSMLDKLAAHGGSTLRSQNVLGTLSLNTFKGTTSAEVRIVDFKPGKEAPGIDVSPAQTAGGTGLKPLRFQDPRKPTPKVQAAQEQSIMGQDGESPIPPTASTACAIAETEDRVQMNLFG